LNRLGPETAVWPPQCHSAGGRHRLSSGGVFLAPPPGHPPGCGVTPAGGLRPLSPRDFALSWAILPLPPPPGFRFAVLPGCQFCAYVRANSSAGPERLPYTQDVGGSNPSSPIVLPSGTPVAVWLRRPLPLEAF